MSQTVDRALVILNTLGERPLSLNDVANLLGVHKSTGLRLLQTLQERRFVRRGHDDRYRLGSRILDLANQALEDMDVRREAAPYLDRLRRSCGHTVHLAVYEEGAVFYIDKYEGSETVRMYSRIGKPAPLHCTGVAKVLLADLPEDELLKVVGSIEFVRYTDNTITDPDQFIAELRRVREQGHAVDNREHEDYVNCISAAIRNVSGRTIAAVSITAPVVVRDLDDLMALLPELRQITDTISSHYGWTAVRSFI